MTERTPWYPATTDPVRFGWYEYRTPTLDTEWVPAFWTGTHWLEQVCGTERLEELGPYPDEEWRGLTKPAKESK